MADPFKIGANLVPSSFPVAPKPTLRQQEGAVSQVSGLGPSQTQTYFGLQSVSGVQGLQLQGAENNALAQFKAGYKGDLNLPRHDGRFSISA